MWDVQSGEELRGPLKEVQFFKFLKDGGITLNIGKKGGFLTLPNARHLKDEEPQRKIFAINPLLESDNRSISRMSQLFK